MISLKSELEGLSRVIKIFGWLAVIIGIMGIIALATTPGLKSATSITNTALILSGGVLYLVIAEGLLKKKKWSWYLAVIVFVISSASNFIAGSIVNMASGIMALIFLALLLKGKKIIFEQSEINI